MVRSIELIIICCTLSFDTHPFPPHVVIVLRGGVPMRTAVALLRLAFVASLYCKMNFPIDSNHAWVGGGEGRGPLRPNN